jgi:nitrogen PTS system EIIA component
MKNERRVNAVTPPTRVSDSLTEKNICFFAAGTPKPQIFEKLINTLKLPNPGLALQAILDREQWGSTTIAPGLALPHARITGLEHLVAAMGICVEAPQIYLLFLGPADNMQEHLAFLACVSSLFQTKGFLDTIVQLKTPKLVLDKIREMEKAL